MERVTTSFRCSGLRVSATTLAAVLAMSSTSTLAATFRTLGQTAPPSDNAVRVVTAAVAAIALEFFGSDSPTARTSMPPTIDAAIVSIPMDDADRTPIGRHELLEHHLDLPPPVCS